MKRTWANPFSVRVLRQRIASLETTTNDMRLQLNDIDSGIVWIMARLNRIPDEVFSKEIGEDEYISNNPGEE